jgi:hypothetical protein
MKKNYKASINLVFDYKDDSLLDGYIPSKTHASVLKALLEGVTKKNSPRAHLIYGPYGTGKSYLANVFLNIVLNNSNIEKSKVFKAIQDDNDFENVFDMYKLFKLANQKMIPIFFNGYEGDLKTNIIEKLSPIISDFKIKIDHNVFSIYQDVIHNWINNFPKTYEVFVTTIKAQGLDIDYFNELMYQNNSKAVDNFFKIYSTITSGAKLESYSAKNSLIILERVLNHLKKENLGIVFIYDEFGRFLQNTQESELISTLQDLQDLAELANNGASNFSFVLIAHKPINNYFLRFPSDFKPEFERIEKRFKAHPISTNDKITYKLARSIIEDSHIITKDISKRKIQNELNNLNKSNFFKDFSQNEIVEDLIKGVYPFSPFTIAYLNILSSVYGQNERSMMSFLQNAQEKEFHEKAISIFAINSYFFPNLDLLPEDSIYLKIFKKKFYKSNSLSKNKYLYDLYLVVTLWYALGLQNIEAINADSLAIILGVSENYIDIQLNELVNEGLLRRNSIHNSYEPFESSGLNIEKLIDDRLGTILFENSKIENELIDILGFSYIRASFYNFKFKMTRFAKVFFYFGFQNEIKIDKFSDFAIDIYFVEETSSQTEIDKLKQKYNSEKFRSLIIQKVNLKNMKHQLDKLITANYLLHNPGEFKNFQNFTDDLEFYISELRMSLSGSLRSIIEFKLEDSFYYLNRQLSVKNKFDINKELSFLIEQLYPNTLTINNDQINKFNLTTVQKNALEILGNRLITFNHVQNGSNGPEVLAYLTIFKENLFDPFIYENENFGNFKELKEKIYSLLGSEIKVSELTHILQDKKEGYFLRPVLIPVVLLGLLRPIWENLMFYGNKTYIKDVDYRFFERMIFDEQANFTVNRIIYSESQLSVMNHIIDKLGQFEPNKYLPRHTRAYLASTKWLRDFGQYIQQTNQLSERTRIFRDSILQSEFIPLEAFSMLGDNFTDFEIEINEINNFLNEKRDVLFNKLKTIFNVNSIQELKEKARQFKTEIHVGNKLASTILKSLTPQELIDNLCLRIMEIEFKNISDSIFDLLYSQIEILSKLAIAGEFNQDELNVVSLNNQIIALPKVEKSITGQNLKERIIGMVSASKLRVSKEEIAQILFDILKEKVGEGN